MLLPHLDPWLASLSKAHSSSVPQLSSKASELESARLLGYRRRPAAESAPGHGLRQVGMVVKARTYDQLYANPFYGPVMAAIEEACRRQQINLLYATVPVDADNHPQELPRTLLEDELDGLLFIGAFVDATITQLMARRTTPTVLVDAYAAENGHVLQPDTPPPRLYDSVVSDNFRGADAMAITRPGCAS